MGFLNRIFTRMTKAARQGPALLPLWNAIVAEARQPDWYLRHAVADTVDGRFDMVALVTALVMLRLEREGRIAETSQLTECFVEDMDGSLRDIGIGDMVIGKHVSRMAGALGGRIGAYRAALADGADQQLLADAINRNVYRGTADIDQAAAMAADVRALDARIAQVPIGALLEGRLA